jgi:hypothetical protein
VFTQALLLNADYRPIRVIPWQRAVVLVLEGTARVVEDRVFEGLHHVLLRAA